MNIPTNSVPTNSDSTNSDSSNSDVIYLDESGNFDGSGSRSGSDTGAYAEAGGEDTPAQKAGAGVKKSKRLDRDYLSRLPISHLIRHFLLLAFALIFLLTTARAGYLLWQMGSVESVGELVSSFLMGLRFDIALVGLLLAVPVLIVPLLAMFGATRGLAKFFSITWMILALAVVLLLELITPYTLQQQGLRPDLSVLTAIGDPVALLSQLWSKYIIPALIGILLAGMVFWAFIARLDVKRFLRHPVRVLPALCVALIGCALCVLAAKGSVAPPGLTFGQHNALVAQESVINEITSNTVFKTAQSLLPF